MGDISLSTLRTWLNSLLGDQEHHGQGGTTWEVTPETTSILSCLYTRHLHSQQNVQILAESLSTASSEYEGEQERIQNVLEAAGPGVLTSLRQGPAQSYTDNIVGTCLSLDQDTCAGTCLQLALSKALVDQTHDVSQLAKQRNEIEALKANLVGLFEKLSRAKEELVKATKLDQEQNFRIGDYNKKVEFLSKKCIEYRRSIEKKEAILTKNGGNDPSIKHAELVKLKDKLALLDEELKPLSRQLQGFMSLPASVELARVELSKCGLELEKIDGQLTGSISDLHL